MICISSIREETSGRKCNDDTMAMMICLLACALFLLVCERAWVVVRRGAGEQR
jgi:hypothetical protein